jgi:hypothetical protein
MPKGARNVIRNVTGSCLVTFTAGSAVVPTYITPGNYVAAGLGNYSPKLLALSNCFQLFRVTKLTVEMNPANFIISAAGAAGLGLIGYSPDQIVGTAPSTPAGVCDLTWRMPYCGNGNTTGTGVTQVIRRTIPKAVLHGQNIRWFNTRENGATPSDLFIQGALYCWGSTFSALGSGTFIVDYVISFKDFIDPTFVPQKSLVPFCGQDLLQVVAVPESPVIVECDDEKKV